MCMQMLTFLDSEPSWLCSKLVAWLRLYLGTTGLLPVWEPCSSSVCVHALSSTSSCYFSHLCEAAQGFMKLCCLFRGKLIGCWFQVRKLSTFPQISRVFFYICPLKGNGYFFSILLKYQVVSLLVVRTGELVLEMYFFATDFPEHGVRIFSD